MQLLLQQLDRDGDGTISVQEFTQACDMDPGVMEALYVLELTVRRTQPSSQSCYAAAVFLGSSQKGRLSLHSTGEKGLPTNGGCVVVGVVVFCLHHVPRVGCRSQCNPIRVDCHRCSPRFVACCLRIQERKSRRKTPLKTTRQYPRKVGACEVATAMLPAQADR